MFIILLRIYLVEILSGWWNLIVIAIGGIFSGGAIVAAINARRFGKLDDAKVKEKLAEVRRLDTETDLKIVEQSQNLVNTLTEQLKRVLDSHELIEKELEAEKKRCADLEYQDRQKQFRIENLERLLNEEKEHCKDMANQLREARIKLEQFERIKRNPM